MLKSSGWTQAPSHEKIPFCWVLCLIVSVVEHWDQWEPLCIGAMEHCWSMHCLLLYTAVLAAEKKQEEEEKGEGVDLAKHPGIQ